jgi:gliding motility-associated-like protein
MVEVIEGNEILIPNAFTPNLDGSTGGSRYSSGRNDVFYPVTEGVIAYKMQIYNRWGEILFDTDDTSRGWDGYYRLFVIGNPGYQKFFQDTRPQWDSRFLTHVDNILGVPK